MQLKLRKSSRIGKRTVAGFSLIEVAISIGVIALAVGSVAVPLTMQIARRNADMTQVMLEQAKETLFGFAAAGGRLPCPATDTSNGFEAFAAGGNATNGLCAVYIGLLPAATLGISPIDTNGYALDAWGTSQNRIRYAVAWQTLNGETTPFTKAGGMRKATSSWVAGEELLFVCAGGAGIVSQTRCWNDPTNSTNTLTWNAPVVLWSTGANAATGGTSVHEIENPNPNNSNPANTSTYRAPDKIFVSRNQQDEPAFDDIVTWISGPLLVQRMIVAGQLP